MSWFQQFFEVFGGAAALVLLAAFLSKRLVIHWLFKDLEIHKTNLEKVSLEHRIKFQQIYVQRHQALAELHKSIQRAVQLASQALRPKVDSDIPKAVEAVNIACDKISEYEIYLPREFCEKWQEDLGKTHFLLHDLTIARAQRTSDWVGDQKQLAAVVGECFEQLQKLNREIADDCRAFIGVEKK